jgi:hypothetical protein
MEMDVTAEEVLDGWWCLMRGSVFWGTEACVEGTAEDMHGLADAIIEYRTYRAKRCEVGFDGLGHFWIHSPRNAENGDALSDDDAQALAAQILRDVPKPAPVTNGSREPLQNDAQTATSEKA